MKKWVKFLFSMKFALIILGLFVAACILGSVIPQGQTAAVYARSYPGWSGVLLAVGADDVFHCWWFIALTLVLCLNLLGCNLVHVPELVSRMAKKDASVPMGEALGFLTGDRGAFLKAMGFRDQQGIYHVRNRLGHWGPWLTHLGLLIVILGFALGQMYTVKYTVYGVPGQEKPVGDTSYSLKIEDFSVLLREDDTVEQYLAELTLTDTASRRQWSGQASVNHPWDAAGFRFYQNSTGWAADMQVTVDEQVIYETTVCAGEVASIPQLPQVQVFLRAIYPDCVLDVDGTAYSASGRLAHPGYAHALFYMGSLMGEKVLTEDECITLRGRNSESTYAIRFVEPRSYTLIQIKRDPFTWLAGLGSAVLLAALVIAFYVRTEELWLVPEEGGWYVYGRSRRGGLLYREKLLEKLRECNEVKK